LVPSRLRRTPAPSDFQSIFSNNSKRRCSRHPNIPSCQRCSSLQYTILPPLALGYPLTMPRLRWTRDRHLIPHMTIALSPPTTSLQDTPPLRHISPVLHRPRVSTTSPPPRLACSICRSRPRHASLFTRPRTRHPAGRAVQTATSTPFTTSLMMKPKCLSTHPRQSRSLRHSHDEGGIHPLSSPLHLLGQPLRS
jgi:hypothetical protein